MNSVELVAQHFQDAPDRAALWFPKHGTLTFGALERLAAQAQALIQQHNVRPGDAVLLFDTLSPRMYGAIIGILATGAHVVLAEPWMNLSALNDAIACVSPKLFLTSWVGRLWGYRSSVVRAIPEWANIGNIDSGICTPLEIADVDPKSHGIVTFTSGTTGAPKGVVRQQGYLVEQQRVLTKHLGSGQYAGPDLCIFANLALSNLALGRTSLVVASDWRRRTLHALDTLPSHLQPETVTCGPAFLLALMKHAQLPHIRSVNVGGALTDCWIFEQGFDRWPDAQWTHVYGGSEVEPVCIADARTAVARSRESGYFQTLYLGSPVAELDTIIEPDTAWVSGDHVCPFYLGDKTANTKNKRIDATGTVWHRMGDRIVTDEDGWWYAGRSHQKLEDFQLEQAIYSAIDTSTCFVHRNTDETLDIVGKITAPNKQILLDKFENISAIVETKVYRDRRHGARLDREKMWKKGRR